MAGKILVVDDDVAMRELLAALLEAAKFQVRAADSADEALRIAHEQQPDLLLIDLRLGKADGFSVAREIRHQTRRSVPAVAVSASDDQATRDRVRRAAFKGLIVKPIDPGTFAQTIAAYVGGGRSGGSTAGFSLSEQEGERMRLAFIQAVLRDLRTLGERTDAEFFSDSLLADAAHRWVGASGINGVPDVREAARELERLGERRRAEQLPHIREMLGAVRQQFEA